MLLFLLRYSEWTAKNHHASECDTMTKFVFATVAALLEQKLNPYLRLMKGPATGGKGQGQKNSDGGPLHGGGIPSVFFNLRYLINGSVVRV